MSGSATTSVATTRSGRPAATLAVADSGPLYAAADLDDRAHAHSVEVLRRPDVLLVLPALVVAEVTYMVGNRPGARAEAVFLRRLSDLDVAAPAPEDWPRVADLVARYANSPLGGVGASVVALAERLGTDLVITLDRRHFAAIQPLHRRALRLLPEGA